ncbi:MAG: hypothetical protein DMF64_18935 [Acidobacteria bacterium]|nr:MAG: hypothetical protein DMF64_18935 [Acidobacteriota bacterium]
MPPTELVKTFPARDNLEAVRADLAVRVPAVVASGFIVLRGDVAGVISASSKLRRRTRAVAAGEGFDTDAATGEVDDASVFKAGDVLKDGTGATIGTVQSVNTMTNVITLTGNAAVAVAADAEVLGSDGSQVAAAISDDETDGTADANVSPIISALLDEAKLRGLDATAKTQLGGVSVVGGIFKF